MGVASLVSRPASHVSRLTSPIQRLPQKKAGTWPAKDDESVYTMSKNDVYDTSVGP